MEESDGVRPAALRLFCREVASANLPVHTLLLPLLRWKWLSSSFTSSSLSPS